MRKFTFIALFAILLTGCNKVAQPYHFSRAYGEPIIFGSASSNGTDTRASYSGELTDGYERIDWEYGDTIRIFCNQAKTGTGPYKDYFITSGTIDGSGRASRAGIQRVGDTGLQWGAVGNHIFTCLSPSPEHGISGTSIEEGIVTCVLPAVQTHNGVTTTDGNSVAAPNPKYIYLTGYGQAEGGEDAEKDPVRLVFDPAITTFEFTLENGFSTNENMTVDSVGIKTASGYLAGPYTVNVSGVDSLTGTLSTSNIGKSSLNSAEVKMGFKPAVTVAKGKTLKFSIFVQPGNDISKLTFWFKETGGTKRSFEFRYAADSSWVSFTAFHKAKISGLIVPKSADWTVNMVPVVSAWNADNKDMDIDNSAPMSFVTPVIEDWSDGESGIIKLN